MEVEELKAVDAAKHREFLHMADDDFVVRLEMMSLGKLNKEKQNSAISIYN